MKFEYKKIDHAAIVKVNIKGATLTDAQDFKHHLQQIYESGNYNIIVDCSEVNYMDSSFLVALVIYLKRCISQGGDLKIVRSNEDKPVWNMFEIARMNNIFNIFYSCEEAAKSIS